MVAYVDLLKNFLDDDQGLFVVGVSLADVK